MISPALRDQARQHIREQRDGHQIMAALLDAINNRETAELAEQAIAKTPAIRPIEILDGEVRRIGGDA